MQAHGVSTTASSVPLGVIKVVAYGTPGPRVLIGTQPWHIPSSGVVGPEDVHRGCHMVAPSHCVRREGPPNPLWTPTQKRSCRYHGCLGAFVLASPLSNVSSPGCCSHCLSYLRGAEE